MWRFRIYSRQPEREVYQSLFERSVKMMKLVFSVIIALAVCQLTAARGVAEPAFEIAPRDAVLCAQDLKSSVLAIVNEMTDNVSQRLARLGDHRRRCESLNGVSQTICWNQYAIQVVFAAVDLATAVRTRVSKRNVEFIFAYIVIILQMF